MKSSVFNPMNFITKESASHSNVLANYKTTNIEESYFLQTLNYINESTREFNSANKVFYKAVLESQGDTIAIHESFSEFFDFIKKIIDKIISFIKALFNKFITALNMAVKSEKYLRNHKDDFKKFGTPHEFKFQGYDFIFPAEVPALKPLADFASSMDEMMGGAISQDQARTNNVAIVKDLQTKLDVLTNRLQDSYYDEQRGETLNRSEQILQSDYANALFTLFRNGSNSKEDMDITSSIVSDTYLRFDNTKKLETEVKKDRDKVEKEYQVIKKQIDSAVKRTTGGIEINTDTADTKASYAFDKDILGVLDLFIKAKSNQIQELSNIHSLAFAAKLDAISDCFKQDKTVLYKALYRISGSLPKEGGN